jgi:hypothetical protein
MSYNKDKVDEKKFLDEYVNINADLKKDKIEKYFNINIDIPEHIKNNSSKYFKKLKNIKNTLLNENGIKDINIVNSLDMSNDSLINNHVNIKKNTKNSLDSQIKINKKEPINKETKIAPKNKETKVDPINKEGKMDPINKETKVDPINKEGKVDLKNKEGKMDSINKETKVDLKNKETKVDSINKETKADPIITGTKNIPLFKTRYNNKHNFNIDIFNQFMNNNESNEVTSLSYLQTSIQQPLQTLKTIEPLKTLEPLNISEPLKITEPLRTLEPLKISEPLQTLEPLKISEQLQTLEPLKISEPLQPLVENNIKKQNLLKELEVQRNAILQRISDDKDSKSVGNKEHNLLNFKNNVIKKIYNIDLVAIGGGGGGSGGGSGIKVIEIKTPFKNKLEIANHIKNNYDLTDKKKINVIFLNEQNKPELFVLSTQMMKNYLKYEKEMDIKVGGNNNLLKSGVSDILDVSGVSGVSGISGISGVSGVSGVSCVSYLSYLIIH